LVELWGTTIKGFSKGVVDYNGSGSTSGMIEYSDGGFGSNKLHQVQTDIPRQGPSGAKWLFKAVPKLRSDNIF
jgi:hypothetical protein